MSNYNCNPWIQRISEAEKAYLAWESKFDCRRLVDYYENFMWKMRTDGPQLNYKPYTLPLFHTTIKNKMASYLFQRPKFNISPEPGHAQWDLDFAVRSAQIKQDTLNTIVKNPNTKFARHMKYSALDSFFRFGMIEVGYAADWRNPLKEDPYLNTWDDPDVTEDKVKVKEQNDVPINERFYVKRIKPQRFRVSVSDAEDLADHEWCGYWQYYYTDTLRKTPGIKFPKDYDGTSYSMQDIGNFSKDSQRGLYLPTSGHARVCKVWNIWDMVANKRKLIIDGYDDEDFEIWSQDFERLPLIDLRWDLRVEGFYPIPPTWYWVASQDEINESREQIRSYRRRFTRKFQMVKGGISEEEAEKFVSGPDGILIETNVPDAIKAIDNPEIGPTSEGALVQAKDDFNIAAGTSGGANYQQSDRQTATASKIVDQRTQILENADQIDFSDFGCLIGREVLCQAQEKLVEGLWVKYSSDPSQEGMLQDMKVNGPIYKFIKAEDLSDGYDFSINIDISNATPVAMQAEETAFLKFNSYLMQFPHLALSPILIRETAYRVGYTNEAVIQQMQQAAALSMAMKAAQAGATGGQIQNAANGQNANNTAKAQMATPDLNTIDNQITNQLQ